MNKDLIREKNIKYEIMKIEEALREKKQVNLYIMENKSELAVERLSKSLDSLFAVCETKEDFYNCVVSVRRHIDKLKKKIEENKKDTK